MGLHHILEKPARERPDQPAVVLGGGADELSYAQLDALSDRLRDRLVAMGVARGDRVGIWLHHRPDALAAIFGILKAGAACVPLDPAAPAIRNAFILHHCCASAVIIERQYEPAWRDAAARFDDVATAALVLDHPHKTAQLAPSLVAMDAASPAPPSSTVDTAPDDLAYLLYISGADGKPRGVMLSHANVLASLDACTGIFQPTHEDLFASLSPLHRDLSLVELLLPIRHSARIVQIPEPAARDPVLISRIIAAHGITVWHSAPSALSLLAQFGEIEAHDYSSLRLISFTGEPFPLVHLRAFKRLVPRPRYVNLYSSAETGICTSFDIPREIPADRSDPYPIGKPPDGISVKLVDAAGDEVERGTSGELCISGPSVSSDYWKNETSVKASASEDGAGARWFRTGDTVIEDPDDNLRLVGRRDRTVKRRGQRVELAEIEAVLQSCTAIREAAVMASPDPAMGVRLIAHVSFRVETRLRLSPGALKAFCAERLPAHMIPDQFSFHVALPRTTMDRIDYTMLKRL